MLFVQYNFLNFIELILHTLVANLLFKQAKA